MVFDIDLVAIIWQGTPVRLRSAFTLSWLKVLAAGSLNTVYTVFKQNRNANLYRLAHNGQICKLEAALNDSFDTAARRIYIADPVYVDAVALYLAAEAPAHLPITLGTATLYSGPELTAGRGFIVRVPTDVATAIGTTRISALVKLYKLPGTSFTIQTF